MSRCGLSWLPALVMGAALGPGADHWRDGLPYGPAVNMAPPATEGINPNFSGCLDREA